MLRNKQSNLKKLSHPREFASCQDGGKKYVYPSFVVWFLRKQGSVSRLGMIVSKKTGSSVVRNRTKRVLRHAFARSAVGQKSLGDFVFLVRPLAKANGSRDSSFMSDFGSLESRILI